MGMKKARRPGAGAELNITSMMDMMTIILVFLLKSYSTQDISVAPSEDLELPVSTVKKNPEMAVNLLLNIKLDSDLPSRSLEEVEKLITADFKVNDTDSYGRTPLHYAALKGHFHVTEALINASANVNQPNARGGTPLHSAASKGHIQAVLALIKGGANPNALEPETVNPNVFHIFSFFR